MKVPITGAAGLVGSHVADALLRRGGSVVICDESSTKRECNFARIPGRSDVQVIRRDDWEDLIRDVTEREHSMGSSSR